MSTRKTIFSQIMSLVSRYEFQKCVDRYNGDRHTRSFTCFDQFKVMSFAQFTDRAGLRDIEMTLEFCGKDLYHAGLCSVLKSTLAEANEKRNWEIYRDFAQILIREAKELYRETTSGLVSKRWSMLWTAPPYVYAWNYLLGQSFIMAKKQ